MDFAKIDDVILVDDGSPYRYMTEGPNLRTIPLAENHGFPYAVNRGLEAATGDILIISNNDIIFNPGWLTGLLKPLEMGYDVSSIRTTDCDGWITEDKITEGDKFGSLWAMKRKVYDTLGGLDESFGRGTFEDLDYRRRALDAGFKIAKNHGSLVEHLGRVTFDRIDPEHGLFESNKTKFKDKWGFIE